MIPPEDALAIVQNATVVEHVPTNQMVVTLYGKTVAVLSKEVPEPMRELWMERYWSEVFAGTRTPTEESER